MFLDGDVITDPSVNPVRVRRRLGLVFQAYNLFPHLTALQNVVLGSVRALGVSKGEAEERGRELLARFGLGGREDDRPDDLSGGQQQRVAIVRAIAARPRALLLDEEAIPVRDEVRGACELLGLDPLHIANEGQLVAIVAPERADRALEALRRVDGGGAAALIGRVDVAPAGTVLAVSAYGGTRVVDMLVGDPLPRIC